MTSSTTFDVVLARGHQPPAARRGWTLLLALAAACLVICCLQLAVGTRPASLPDLLAALFGGGHDADLILAVREVRLPRTLQSLTLGAALATAGLLSQTAAGNRLATPSILGIHNGANLALLVTLITVPAATDLEVSLASFAGALLATLTVLLLASMRHVRRDPSRWLLAGVLLDRFEAGLATAILLAYGMQNTLLGWTMGRLVHVDWQQVALLLPTTAICLVLAALLVPALETLRLGDDVARGLGVRVGRQRILTVVVIVALAGMATAVAGPVAYVGLVVPNLVTRRYAANVHARLVAVALGGALLTGVADCVTRLGSGRHEIPLGMGTLALGATFFLFATLRRRSGAVP